MLISVTQRLEPCNLLGWLKLQNLYELNQLIIS
jgi:hypothetical protein